MKQYTLQDLKKFGIVMDGAKAILDRKNPMQIAQDAALFTEPNAGVPTELTYYFDPEVVNILTSPRRAREIFEMRQKGNWVTSHMRWAQHEIVGEVGPYDDFDDAPTSGSNYNWPVKRQYSFQTNIYYGLKEQELFGEARIDYAAGKQQAAARIIDIAQNRFWLLGVDDLEIYGLLNDPSLPDAITADATGTGGSTYWADKNSVQVYDDYRELFRQLSVQSDGWITQQSRLIAVVSPNTSVDLGASSTYNEPAIDMIKRFTPNVEFVVLPETASVNGTETVWLIAPEIEGQRTGELGYSVLYEASALVHRGPTKWVQKFWASTYGAIIYQTFGIARMIGVAEAQGA